VSRAHFTVNRPRTLQRIESFHSYVEIEWIGVVKWVDRNRLGERITCRTIQEDHPQNDPERRKLSKKDG
jgi:hypothetical protein